ncbi:MAG: NADPH-dependent 7-cyano-7-deazaguanine reductase QueF [Breznakibacter sp.]
MEPIEGKVLGKQVSYPSVYSPDVLVAVPRRLNREQYQLDDADLPFIGMDVWHAYETGFITQKGLPVTGLLKLVYPAGSSCLVESKSLKLYLNSFNMERLGETADDGIQLFLKTVGKDLEKLLGVNVEVNFFATKPSHTPSDFYGYKVLEQLPGAGDLVFDRFTDAPELLEIAHDRPSEYRVATHLLRSNCKITHQPDWGSAFIHLKAACSPDVLSVLKYVVSLRNENHFHEEICEMLFKRLSDAYQPDQLMVACVYTRRGGIDICPVRASHPHLLPPALASIGVLSDKLLRQ